MDELRTFAVSRLTNEARAVLAEQIGKITLVPDASGGYLAKGSIDFFEDTSFGRQLDAATTNWTLRKRPS
jgi:hypothetical protein